ncbi:MAG TPA: YdeI/OmpD-associated family protein [Verrucomicrobiae bacterium]|nr:YdeI/OmpD-associated family protein [Verrucomicrobiae bacterium]
MKIKYFKSAIEFRQWLEVNHARARELWVGLFKKDSGKGGLTYAEAVDEALCFGWIDGLKKRVDDLSYTHRFTPRKPKSNWSRINIQHVERLKKAGRMTPPGLKAHAARAPERSGVYSFENAPRTLAAAQERQFKADKIAWQFFQRQPPGYRRTAIWWVVSAKKPETRARRLGQLIADSRKGRRLAQVSGSKRRP